MSSEQDRRRHRRYPLRLPVKLQRGEQELQAEIINASVGGCLMFVPVALEVGEQITAKMPQIRAPSAKLYVLRVQQTEAGWLVGACFEAMLSDEAALENLSRQFQLVAPAPTVVH
jgi:hypothetical protein